MSVLKNKIDFAFIFSVKNANSNGDPLNGNRPRTDFDGYGEVSDVCLKRKIRNRMQDFGETIFVQSEERADDGKKTLKERADEFKKVKEVNEFIEKSCKKWLDVRTFGQVFAFKGFECASVGVRGPVSIQHAFSVDTVEVTTMQITKSVSGDKKEGEQKGSDTMGSKSYVNFGLYVCKGSINVQLAEKTGFSEEDAEILKECLRTLFVNDTSSARPDGSMEVIKVFWWKHNCKDGQYSSANVHRSINVKKKDNVTVPKSVDDYEISVDKLDNLSLEEIDGL